MDSNTVLLCNIVLVVARLSDNLVILHILTALGNKRRDGENRCQTFKSEVSNIDSINNLVDSSKIKLKLSCFQFMLIYISIRISISKSKVEEQS